MAQPWILLYVVPVFRFSGEDQQRLIVKWVFPLRSCDRPTGEQILKQSSPRGVRLSEIAKRSQKLVEEHDAISGFRDQ